MDVPTRREFLSAVGLAGLGSFAGCTTGELSVTGETTTPVVDLEQVSKLVADDSDDGDQFGHAVAIADDTALVGAPADEGPDGSDSGAAYAFTREGDGWTQMAKLTPGEHDSGSFFGSSVAVTDDTALLGAPGATISGGDGSGAAYVFDETGDGWTRNSTLVAPDGDGGDSFGTSVALAGDLAVVGADEDEDADGEGSGAAYVFERSSGNWTQTTKLVADDADSKDMFGESVAVTDGIVLVGAPKDEDPNGFVGGSAYVFETDGDGWSQTAKLAADDGQKIDFFGGSLAVVDDTAVVGAQMDDLDGEKGVGSVYVFTRDDGGWSQTAHLRADDADADDTFGESVSLSGDTLLVGAKNAENDAGTPAGSSYVFERGDDQWSQVAKLSAEDGESGDEFGESVALEGDRALVGAPIGAGANSGNAGSVYVFESP